MPSPSHDISENPLDDDDDLHQTAFSSRGCCFWIPCFGSKRASNGGSIWWERISTGENKTPSQDPLYLRGWKRLREWSELAAGPRWKTFIRTFRKNRNSPAKQCKFQYDPLSYALNFDDGPGQMCQQMDGDYIARDFSSRYAAVPASIKVSTGMEGGQDSRDFHVNVVPEGKSLL